MEGAIRLLSEYRRPQQLLRNLFAIFNIEGGRRDFFDPERYERLYFAATRINWFKGREEIQKEVFRKIMKFRRLSKKLEPYKKKIEDKQAELISQMATGGSSFGFELDHDYDDMLEELENLAFELDLVFTEPVETISESIKNDNEDVDDKKGIERPEKVADYSSATMKDLQDEIVL